MTTTKRTYVIGDHTLNLGIAFLFSEIDVGGGACHDFVHDDAKARGKRDEVKERERERR